VEEYLTRLYEVLAPARVVSGLLSDDWATGFVLFNATVIALGFLCYVGPVRAGRGTAGVVAWLWVIAEMANGIGHIILAVASKGYFPGLLTALALLVTSTYLALSLRADGKNGGQATTSVA